VVKHQHSDREDVSSIPIKDILEKSSPISPEFDNIENCEKPEGGRKTPISSEIIDVETDKLLKKYIVTGIIR
jgi:hypothetical protein